MMGPDREAVRKTPRYSNMKAMSNFGSSRSCRAACVLAAFSAFSAAPAQDYPSRPVRVVVPSAPGGGFDLVGRVLAQKLGEQTGQAFVVENRPGAGTLVGTQLVARSVPDGYNLVVGGLSNIALNMGLYREPGYDSLADFTCVGLVVSHSYTLVARKDLPLASLAEVIAFARANPGKLNIGTSGPGTGQYIGAAIIAALTGVDIVKVPYKGAQPVYQDLLAGRVDLFYDNTTTTRPYVESGQVKARADHAAASHAHRNRRGRAGNGDLVRPVRAGAHAARNRRAPARRGGPRHALDRSAFAPRDGQRQEPAHRARRDRGVRARGGGQMDGAASQGGHRARVSACPGRDDHDLVRRAIRGFRRILRGFLQQGIALAAFPGRHRGGNQGHPRDRADPHVDQPALAGRRRRSRRGVQRPLLRPGGEARRRVADRKALGDLREGPHRPGRSECEDLARPGASGALSGRLPPSRLSADEERRPREPEPSDRPRRGAREAGGRGESVAGSAMNRGQTTISFSVNA